MQITLKLSPRAISAAAFARAYRETMSDGSPNPETPEAFVERLIIETVIDWVEQGEGARADIAARQAAKRDAAALVEKIDPAARRAA